MMHGLLQSRRLLPFNQNFRKEKGQLLIIGLCIIHNSTLQHPAVFYHMGYIEPSVADKRTGEYYYNLSSLSQLIVDSIIKFKSKALCQ
jgi:hypothetical protein